MPIYDPYEEPLFLDHHRLRRLGVLFERGEETGLNAKIVQIALSRLFEVMNHREPADRLIDAWIALESLLLEYATAELRFRRVTQNCGVQPQARQDADLRSRTSVI